jgi:hypothetical protein
MKKRNKKLISKAMVISSVVVLDCGLTTNCGYDRILLLAKEKTVETVCC